MQMNLSNLTRHKEINNQSDEAQKIAYPIHLIARLIKHIINTLLFNNTPNYTIVKEVV